MRALLSALLLAVTFAAAAQTVSTFETPALPKPDTFLLHSDSIRRDVGFNSGLAHFPQFTDSSGRYSFWDHGFVLSNKADSLTGGPGNQFSARPGKGVNGSSQYAVAYGTYNVINLTGAAIGRPVSGFYATNNAYAYNSIRFGDGFARKFGDTTGTHSGLPQGTMPDYYRMVIGGWLGGTLKPDTVHFYLADYRFTDSTQDYVVKDWRWVDLSKLGAVDSIRIMLESTDTVSFGGTLYYNTPTYFCIDDFTTLDGTGIKTASSFAAKVYPNPSQGIFFMEPAPGAAFTEAVILDMKGAVVLKKTMANGTQPVDISHLATGQYLLHLSGAGGITATSILTKQ